MTHLRLFDSPVTASFGTRSAFNDALNGAMALVSFSETQLVALSHGRAVKSGIKPIYLLEIKGNFMPGAFGTMVGTAQEIHVTRNDETVMRLRDLELDAGLINAAIEENAGLLPLLMNGDDTIIANRSPVVVDALAGDDQIFGGAGKDRLKGGLGDDRLFGGARTDSLFGGAGSDNLYGGDGADFLVGGRGADSVFGGKGFDVLNGGAGADDLFGAGQNDRLFGNKGEDSLVGGRGRDRLEGGLGNDHLTGGSGRDSFVFSYFGNPEHEPETDLISDFEPGEDIQIFTIRHLRTVDMLENEGGFTIEYGVNSIHVIGASLQDVEAAISVFF